MSNVKDAPTLPITRTVLAELNVIALSESHKLDTMKLTYTETQQALTLLSLLAYFQDLGIQLPFHIEAPIVFEQYAPTKPSGSTT